MARGLRTAWPPAGQRAAHQRASGALSRRHHQHLQLRQRPPYGRLVAGPEPPLPGDMRAQVCTDKGEKVCGSWHKQGLPHPLPPPSPGRRQPEAASLPVQYEHQACKCSTKVPAPCGVHMSKPPVALCPPTPRAPRLPLCSVRQRVPFLRVAPAVAVIRRSVRPQGECVCRVRAPACAAVA
jgi:hypothetical protein